MIPLADWLTRTPAKPSAAATFMPLAETAHILDDAISETTVDRALDFALREAELRTAFEEQLAAQHRQLTADFAARQEHLTAHHLDVLTDRIIVAFDAMQSALGEAVTGSLSPVLTAAVAAKAHAGFMQTVVGEVAAGNLARLEITVPPDLADMLREKLKSHPADVHIGTANCVEARAVCSGLAIETRIGDWLKAAGLSVP